MTEIKTIMNDFERTIFVALSQPVAGLNGLVIFFRSIEQNETTMKTHTQTNKYVSYK